MPADSPDSVDPTAVLRRLGLAEPTAVEPVTGGADALLWRATVDDQAYALRVLRDGRREQAEQEVAIFRALAGTAIPVPEVLATAVDADRPAYLMDWVAGRPLAEALLDPATDENVRDRLMIDFGRLQRMINELTGPDLPDRGPDWIERRSTGDAVDQRLRALKVGEPRLLHLDYHPLNVLVRDDKIVAVLDWANATLGDPRYDRARTESILALSPDPDGTLAPLLDRAIAAWRTGYDAADDLDPDFRRWAGAAMLIDLAPRVGNPAVPWLTESHVARIRAYP
ncbi:phosphotransferase family protein [Microlunatus speluncae]|uniref:phosphotransferase family protein n=1 Tax=Microlunatus speluncae TaxID=2594267 RepID=UPI001C2D7329|nr:phosphotransferase [Microlunatus speluncae]